MQESPTFFRDLAYVFLAAIAGGAVAWRLRQPLIIGYVLAGILISPFTPGPAVKDLHTIDLLAEIGVILLMFSVGMEFSVRELLRVKWVALAGGPLGILLSIGLGVAAAYVFGWTLTQGAVIGVVVSVASTMVLTRLLIDHGELSTEAGRVMVAITLVEDLAVVILTVVLPSFGTAGAGSLLNIGQALGRAMLVLVPALFIASRIVPPILTRVARTRSQELFFVVVLAICLGTAALTQAMGLSLALGAFVAGLIVSESDYVHEALAQLFPLRDAFVALFFVTIGLLIDPRALWSNVPLLAVTVGLVLAGKWLIWTSVVRLFGYPLWTAMAVGVGLTQIGEFSFVLVRVARDAGLVGADVYNATLAAALITILLNAALVRQVQGRVSRWRLNDETRRLPEPLPGQTREKHVLLCGFGRVGSSVGTALDAFQVRYGVIELDPDVVRTLRKRGIDSVFGDAAHAHILEQAGAQSASLLIVTLPDIDRALRVVRNARRINPAVPILARAHTRADQQALLQAGANEVIEPELEASSTLIRRSLEQLRIPHPQTAEYLERFRQALESAAIGTSSSRGTEVSPAPVIREVAISGTPLANQSLRETRIRERYGVTVIAVSRASGEIILNPPSDTMLQAGDTIRVFGMPEQLTNLRRES